MSIPQNDNPLNQEALQWLKEAQGDIDPYYLHVLSLACWGLENGVEGDWPRRDRYVVESQVHQCLGWKPENVMNWLVTNPNGPDDESEQYEDLLSQLEYAENPRHAAQRLLTTIYYRMISRE